MICRPICKTNLIILRVDRVQPIDEKAKRNREEDEVFPITTGIERAGHGWFSQVVLLIGVSRILHAVGWQHRMPFDLKLGCSLKSPSS